MPSPANLADQDPSTPLDPMSDPVLKAHCCVGMIFSLGGSLGPGSIRDQMLRAQVLVARLIEWQELVEGSRLVVVGAGAAGVTAALRAALSEVGVEVVLLERGTHLFAAQAGCNSRRIDPALYDWAVDHYVTGWYPWTAEWPPVPLPWKVGRAADLAGEWEASYKRVVPTLAPGRLTAEIGHDFCDIVGRDSPRPSVPGGPDIDPRFDPLLAESAEGHPYRVLVWDRSSSQGRPTPKVYPADVVVLCFGAGPERCFHRWPAHKGTGHAYGYPFWSTDPYGKRSAGVGGRAKVLISGAGDGGIQDFLRLVTKPRLRTSGELYHELGLDPGIEREIQSVQAHVHRLTAFGYDHRHDHPLLRWAQHKHSEIVEGLMTGGSSGEVRGRLARLVRDVEGEYESIEWCYPCQHYTHAYGLNRFLGILLSKYLTETFGGIVRVRPQTRLSSIECEHAHFRDPADGESDLQYAREAAGHCHGKAHRAVMRAQPTCRPRSAGAEFPPVTFDVLVLRNGTEGVVPRLERYLPAIRRQLPPFALIY